MVDKHRLVPGGAYTLLDDTRAGTIATEGHDGVWVREPGLVTGVHVSSLVEVGPQLVGVAIWGVDIALAIKWGWQWT